MLPTWGTYRHPGRLHGARRKREDSNGTVHYLGGYERKLAGGSNSPEAVTKYYSASFGALSRPVAFRRGGTLHWLGADHLGGTIRVLDSSFTALDGMRYKPYGEDRDTGNALVTDRKFTGQTADEAAGLYWYASRAYDPAIGRFVSPDSIVPAPGNPQSLNRYSYVYNNPLKFVDPSGHTGRSPKDKDPAWAERFTTKHGYGPTWQDYFDYQFSLLHPGSGPNGTWTDQDWIDYHNTIKPTNRTREAHLAQYYNPTYKAPFPETYYIVQDETGYEFKVFENVSGFKLSVLDFFGAEAGVYWKGELWARGDLDYGTSYLYWHEVAHIYQLKVLEEPVYWAAYIYYWDDAMRVTGGDDSQAHKIHPFEVDAREYSAIMIRGWRRLHNQP